MESLRLYNESKIALLSTEIERQTIKYKNLQVETQKLKEDSTADQQEIESLSREVDELHDVSQHKIIFKVNQ